MKFIGVNTKIGWIGALAGVPILGHAFVLLLMFGPAAVCSFSIQAAIPLLSDDLGFTKAMFVSVPLLNLLMWIAGIRLYLFFLPSWIMLGVIAAIKLVLLMNGVPP